MHMRTHVGVRLSSCVVESLANASEDIHKCTGALDVYNGLMKLYYLRERPREPTKTHERPYNPRHQRASNVGLDA